MINGGGVVESARRGDLFAFQTLVERYQSAIYRYIYRLVADTDLARDLTIDTFLLAHKNLSRVDKDVRFDAWLHRLAIRVAKSALFRRRLTAWLPRAAGPAHLSSEDDQDAQSVQRALLRLPIEAAIHLLLRSLAGFSYEEIAQITRHSQRQVRVQITAARRFFASANKIADPRDTTCIRVRSLLSAFLDRQLSGEELAAVNAHLATCSTCPAVVAEYQDIDRRLARLRTRGASVAVAYEVGRILRGEKPERATKVSGKSRRGVVLALISVTVLVGASALASLAVVGRRGAAAGSAELYVALQNSEGQIAVIDVAGARLVKTIPLGGRPSRLVASRDGSRVYAITDDGILSTVDTSQGAVTDRYMLGGRPVGIALSPDDKLLYISLWDRRNLVVLDPYTGQQVGDIRVGRLPREVLVTPDGQWLLVYNSGDSTLSKVKISTRQEVKVFRLLKRGDEATEFALHPMAASPDGRKVYVSELNRERIWTIDLVSDEALATDVPLRDFGRDILVASSGDRLYVTHGDPRGTRAALAGLASMSLPRIERNAELRGFYHGVVASPDGLVIYATNPDENVVVFADTQTLQPLETIPVGLRPTSIVYVTKVK